MSRQPQETAWQKLMNTAMSKNKTQETNILVFGDHSSGKRSLLQALLANLNQKNDLNLKYDDSILLERKKKFEHLYIFDYRYLRVNRFEDDDSSEIGKVNFYCLNRKFTVT